MEAMFRAGFLIFRAASGNRSYHFRFKNTLTWSVGRGSARPLADCRRYFVVCASAAAAGRRDQPPPQLEVWWWNQKLSTKFSCRVTLQSGDELIRFNVRKLLVWSLRMATCVMSKQKYEHLFCQEQIHVHISLLRCFLMDQFVKSNWCWRLILVVKLPCFLFFPQTGSKFNIYNSQQQEKSVKQSFWLHPLTPKLWAVVIMQLLVQLKQVWDRCMFHHVDASPPGLTSDWRSL